MNPDPVREQRIQMEAVVDADDEAERALGWYYYLESHLDFPFVARCTARRAISPLRPKDEVEVTGMAPDEECEHEIFVMIKWEKDGLAVPLSQLRPVHADDATRQAVADWHYWVKMHYCF